MENISFENWLDLKQIYSQLSDEYAIELTSGLALDAGFDWDLEVLTGKSVLGIFYLYFNGIDAILDYDSEHGKVCKHWHPVDMNEAVQMVIDFMEGKLV